MTDKRIRPSFLFREGRYIYCSKCGGKVGQADYNMRQHIRSCSGAECCVSWSEKNIKVYSAGIAGKQELFARFFGQGDKIIFGIFRIRWSGGETIRSIRQNSTVLQMYDSDAN